MKVVKTACLAIAIAQFATVGAQASAFSSPLALQNAPVPQTSIILAHGGKHKHVHCHKRRNGVICHRHWHRRHRHHA